jgi:SAM-dependent methyltransferase
MGRVDPSIEILQQELYAKSSEIVRGRGINEAQAIGFYPKYLYVFMRFSGFETGRVLDVGCGNGWSSDALAQRGLDVVRVDLNAEAFEPPADPRLELREGSAMELDAADDSFDVVASYQMLEHIPNPEAALDEMFRVLRPGGTAVIVSPNLLSILAPLRGICVHAWKNRPFSTIFVRTPEMPRRPAGNTIPENIGSLVTVPIRLASPRARFTMRKPALRSPFHADNDVCYVCNPVDLAKFFRAKGRRIVQLGRNDRPPLSWLVSSTYIAVRKPEDAPAAG